MGGSRVAAPPAARASKAEGTPRDLGEGAGRLRGRLPAAVGGHAAREVRTPPRGRSRLISGRISGDLPRAARLDSSTRRKGSPVDAASGGWRAAQTSFACSRQTSEAVMKTSMIFVQEISRSPRGEAVIKTLILLCLVPEISRSPRGRSAQPPPLRGGEARRARRAPGR